MEPTITSLPSKVVVLNNGRVTVDEEVKNKRRIKETYTLSCSTSSKTLSHTICYKTSGKKRNSKPMSFILTISGCVIKSEGRVIDKCVREVYDKLAAHGVISKR